MSELLYAIVGHDVPDSLPLRRELRPRHLDHLRALQDEGRLIAAGPRPAVDAIDPDVMRLVPDPSNDRRLVP